MRNVRVALMAIAVVVAVSGAFATKISKKFFVVAYVPPAPSSCQMTTKPDICNTIGSQFCTISGNTFYQNIIMGSSYVCVNEWRKDP